MNKIEAIRNLFQFNWPSNEQLIEFTEKGHGFGGDNGYYGLTYPSDLDEYSKANGEFVPEGFLEVYYWSEPNDFVHVKENNYLLGLANYL